MTAAQPTSYASFVSCELPATHRVVVLAVLATARWCFSTTFQRGFYFTATTEVLWMDFMTAARRLHRSWAWLTWTLGGSLRITVSAEPSRTLGRNSPSFTCKESEKRRSRRAKMDFSPMVAWWIVKRWLLWLSAACASTYVILVCTVIQWRSLSALPH